MSSTPARWFPSSATFSFRLSINADDITPSSFHSRGRKTSTIHLIMASVEVFPESLPDRPTPHNYCTFLNGRVMIISWQDQDPAIPWIVPPSFYTHSEDDGGTH